MPSEYARRGQDSKNRAAYFFFIVHRPETDCSNFDCTKGEHKDLVNLCALVPLWSNPSGKNLLHSLKEIQMMRGE